MEHQATRNVAESAREAAEAGDYTRAAALAAIVAPGMEMQLEQYRLRMQDYERASAEGDWRKALRALADARLAALAAGVFGLEQVANERLYDLVKQGEVRRS
ncbi:MAG: hypothetical protein ACOY94_27195 [Bacillota bacterium]